MKKKIMIILNVALIIVLIIGTYAWMQTEASRGENIEYNRNFYITDSDIEVKLFALVNNVYVEQIQYRDEPLIRIDEMYPGKIQRYRFQLTNNNPIAARVKIVFTELTGDVDTIKYYMKVNGTNPDLFSFMMSDKIEKTLDTRTSTERYHFDFAPSVTIPANSSINYYWNFELGIDAPNTLQGTTFEVGRIMFIKPN